MATKPKSKVTSTRDIKRAEELLSELESKLDNWSRDGSLNSCGLDLKETTKERIVGDYEREIEKIYESLDESTMGNLTQISYVLDRVKELKGQEKIDRINIISFLNENFYKIHTMFLYLGSSTSGNRGVSIKHLAPQIIRNLTSENRDIVPQDLVVAECIETLFSTMLRRNLFFGSRIAFRSISPNKPNYEGENIVVIFPETGYEVEIEVPTILEPNSKIKFTSIFHSTSAIQGLADILQSDYELMLNKNSRSILTSIFHNIPTQWQDKLARLRISNTELFDNNLALLFRSVRLLNKFTGAKASFSCDADIYEAFKETKNYFFSFEPNSIVIKNEKLNFSLVVGKELDFIRYDADNKLIVLNNYENFIELHGFDESSLALDKSEAVIENFIKQKFTELGKDINKFFLNHYKEAPKEEKVEENLSLSTSFENNGKKDKEISLVSDAKEVATRIAAKSIVERTQKLVLSKLNLDDSNSGHALVKNLLESELGFALIGFILSNVGSSLNIQMPELLEEIKLAGFQGLSDKLLSETLDIIKNVLTEAQKRDTIPEIKLIENKVKLSHENSLPNAVRDGCRAKE